jgi:hypothetical protein
MTTVTLTLGNQLIVKRDGREVARMDIVTFSGLCYSTLTAYGRGRNKCGTRFAISLSLW